MSSPSRNALIDAMKGLACATIVCHHLAFYGPMSDIARPLMPAVLSWFSAYGRMAVQVFLVLAGYLAASSLAPAGVARFDSASQQIGRRFVRLVVPYAVALVVAVLASAAVRPWLDHPSVPSDPDLPQLLANALLLQDIVGEEALSAGVWYVAIDFQLFAAAVLLFAGVRLWPGLQAGRAARVGQALVAVATAASLLVFNRQPALDMWAVYFWGAYGLGMLACWAARSPRPWLWLGLIALLGGASLAIDFRGRIAVALCTALVLAWLMRQPGLTWPARGERLQRLGRMSYSVFLVHFPVCLVVNALFNHWWPDAPVLNAFGMAAAFVLSLSAGRLLYRRVEMHVPSWTLALRWQAGLVGTGLAVALAGSLLT